MNPFNRSNDMPNNPLSLMTQNTSTMNPNKDMSVPPGGRAQTDEGSAEGDAMQFSRQGGQSYSGNRVYNNSSPSAKTFGGINTPK